MTEQIKINETRRMETVGEGKTSFTLGVRGDLETTVAFLPGTPRGKKAEILRKERAAFRGRED
jgi:hypothetical protein